MVTYAYLEMGTCIAHVPRLERVADALKEVRPSLFVTVPRLLERAYTGVVSQVAQAKGPKRVIAQRALHLARSEEPTSELQ